MNVSDGGAALKAKLTSVQSNASAVVDSAKNDFPNETSAISSSVDTLKTALQRLSSSPSASDLATIATDARNVQTSVNNFVSATKSKCE